MKVGLAQSRTEQNNIKVVLRPLQTLGQVLGIFPDFQEKGMFKKILLAFYTAFVVFETFFLMLHNVFFIEESQKKDRTTVASYVGHVHTVYGLIVFNSMLFIRLAISWPCLIEKWSSVDADLFNDGRYGYPWYLKWICPAIILLNVLISVGQVCTAYNMVYTKLSSIPANNGTVHFTTLAHAMFPQLSELMALLWYPAFICVYSIVLAHLVFSTIFFDAFVMVVSFNLASRLRQFNTFAKGTFKASPKPQHFWTNIRRDYPRLTNLVSFVDDKMCLITLCTYARIIMYLVVMLTTFLAKVTTPAEKLYCFFCGFHNFTTLILLTLFSGWINEESTRIVRVLGSVPLEMYDSEVRRFLLQISFDDVALTGCKMFKLKKSLILKVINAVVTYELIIIQYWYNK